MTLFHDDALLLSASGPATGLGVVPLFRVPASLDEFLSDGEYTGASNVIGGYRTAATGLAGDILTRLNEAGEDVQERLQTGQLIPPYLFLWRQHLELSLKQCLQTLVRHRDAAEVAPREWERYFGAPIATNLFSRRVAKSHSLLRLWTELESYAEAVWSMFSVKHTDAGVLDPPAAGELLVELDSVDPGGTGARYSVDAHGNRGLADLKEIDLPWTQRNLERLSDFLVSVQIDVWRIHGMPEQVADHYRAHPWGLYMTGPQR